MLDTLQDTIAGYSTDAAVEEVMARETNMEIGTRVSACLLGKQQRGRRGGRGAGHLAQAQVGIGASQTEVSQMHDAPYMFPFRQK